MIIKKNSVLLLTTLVLSACGGGGGGGGAPSVVRPTILPTTIAGVVTPPASPTSAPGSASSNMLIGPNSSAAFGAIVQSMDYTFDPLAAAGTPSALKVTTLSVKPVGTSITSYVILQTGAAYPLDPLLGMGSYVLGQAEGVAINTGTSVVSQTTLLAGLPTVTLVNNATVTSAGYVLPYSATLNPSGYTYQTFGVWAGYSGGGVFSENYFSAGAATNPVTLPSLGTASYTGRVAGSLVDAVSRDPSDISATMNATADFAARTVAFSTTGTTSLSNNAAAGTLPTANAGLNMSGTLSYAAGSNTFTGAVTTGNGMSGNATGRFYGPGIAVATPTKAVGAPPEIGGTFAVAATGVGAMQGAFGGK